MLSEKEPSVFQVDGASMKPVFQVDAASINPLYLPPVWCAIPKLQLTLKEIFQVFEKDDFLQLFGPRYVENES